MTIAYFDTIAGIAGDMTMASLISAGVSFDELTEELKKLNVPGFELTARHIQRSAIDAVQCDVVITNAPHYHRHLKDILGILGDSGLSAGVRERATAIFTVLARAEAKVHNTTIEKIHFHEVGALDSIVDIVGTCICLEKLGIEEVYSSPVRLGSGGIIKTQHGMMPTPAPATAEILQDYPVVLTTVPAELTTPTGAAIIKALSKGVLTDETLRIRSVGYGAGTKEFEALPNLLRVVIGELAAEHHRDTSVVLETNIDDMNPQLYPYVLDRLLAAGAHDAYLIPVIMKKGRPGILLSVLTDPARVEEISAVIFRETSSIGLRIQTVGRRKLARRALTVNTSLGPVQAKAVERDGSTVVTAEYEECKRIATARNLPLAEVMRIVNTELRSSSSTIEEHRP
jgi:pyridinium-3,5-bisthiocarboxylic acid mononucleotide nickel chelatase